MTFPMGNTRLAPHAGAERRPADPPQRRREGERGQRPADEGLTGVDSAFNEHAYDVGVGVIVCPSCAAPAYAATTRPANTRASARISAGERPRTVR